jgi:hypothetical protein
MKNTIVDTMQNQVFVMPAVFFMMHPKFPWPHESVILDIRPSLHSSLFLFFNYTKSIWNNDRHYHGNDR